MFQVDLPVGGVSNSLHPTPGQSARRWAADPLALLGALLVVAVTLIVVGSSSPLDHTVALAVLAAVIAGVALSGST